jgi:hypothetical protein
MQGKKKFAFKIWEKYANHTTVGSKSAWIFNNSELAVQFLYQDTLSISSPNL